MLALWQDNWRTAPLLTSPRPLLLEAAGHRENFPSCLHFHLESQKIGTQNGSALNNHGGYKNVR